MRIKRRLITFFVAVLMMTSVSAVSASAFQATKYVRASGGSGTNAYVSCIMTGSYYNTDVSGMAWTKTSSNNYNVFSPNCAYTGYAFVSTLINDIGCGSSSGNNTSSVTKNFGLEGCSMPATVKTVHVYSSSVHGYYSTMLEAET